MGGTTETAGLGSDGAGTLLEKDQVKRAKEAGAVFGLAPGINPNTIGAANEIGLQFSPGVMTPSEVLAAREHGFALMKLFPAAQAGGLAMLQALGARFTDALGKALVPGGGALLDLAHIDFAPVLERFAGVEVLVATDVTNVLLGPRGAAAVFSPQKGASAEQVVVLERGLQHYAACARAHGFVVDTVPGSGAAGGIGGTLFGVLGAGTPGAQIVSGVALVMRTVGLEQQLQDADIVITGEGSLDAQSAAGKVPAGVCALAKQHGVQVIALAGVVSGSLQPLHEQGLTAAFSIAPGPLSRAEALANAAQNLARTAEQIARLLHAMR